MNILIADNDLVELRRLYLLLQTATDPRPALFVATTPAQAAAYARTERIDVVFTEIFPGEPDAFRPIRALQARHPAANIIIVSGSADYAFPAWQLHASDYLLKPVVAGAVRASLDNLRALECVRQRMAEGALQVHGWYFDMDAGELLAWQPQSGCFQSIGRA